MVQCVSRTADIYRFTRKPKEREKTTMRKLWIIGLIGVALTVSGANCLGPWTPEKARIAALRTFNSSEELRQFLVEQANNRLNAQRGGGGDWFGFFDLGLAPAPSFDGMADGADQGAEADSAAGGGEPFSTTNIQEAGVDESDLVKNDGQNIYWLDGSTIHVAQATPAENVAEVAIIDIESNGDSLYLRGSTLIALSSRYIYYSEILSSPSGTGTSGAGDATGQATAIVGGPWNDGQQVAVTVIDVSVPSSPTIEATVNFEGRLASSRLIDNQLYLVLTTQPRLPADTSPAALEAMSLDDWLPDYSLIGGDGQSRSGDITSWQGFFAPVIGDGYSITTVVTLDVDNPTGETQSTAITADTSIIYASTQALYITDIDYDWDLLSSRTDTMVHKLAFGENGTEYVASGLVPGRPINQYSLGEYEDYLRIATTDSSWSIDDGPLTSNAVYVLGKSGGDLSIVGQVEGLGEPGEEIYAARFIGPRGFVVTFQRTDPLYTLDLSDPTNPQVAGGLKIPGYSDHIQLLDENHLLTIGKDAEPAGDWGAWVQGVQLAIFDVSDMANPQLKYKEVIGGRGTNSEANYNPKAFNYFAAKGVLAFPIDLYSGDTTGPVYGDHTFTGLLVYGVSADTGFAALGRISTVDEGQTSSGCWWNYYGSTRGVFIGDYVYAVSDLGVKATSLDDVSTIVGEAPFTGASADEDCFYDDPWILPLVAEGLR